MAQQQRNAKLQQVMHHMLHTRHRGRLIVGAVALVLVVIGVVMAGSLWAGGETFQITRGSGSVTEATDTVDATDDDQGNAEVATDGADDGAAAAPGQVDAENAAASVVVDVDGAVAQPGVYELQGRTRVADAIAAAGGLAADADTTSLNQAALVSDGEKIYVPREGEEVAAGQSGSTSGTETSIDTDGGTSGGTSSAGLVNINTASSAELDTLPGVGPAIAEAIIEERETNGLFSSPEDIMRVSGIGEKKYEQLADLICV